MDEIEEIKRRIDIVDLISQYLTLKKSGVNYKATCPFHQEKTPSFMVSPEKQIFKCFGCQKAGDVFSFMMEMEGLNFREALELLSQRAGVELKTSKSKAEYKQEKDIKTKLYQINKLSAQVFSKILLEHNLGKNALSYLQKRGLKKETIKQFQIGYAPTRPLLVDFLRKRGFSQEEIYQAGSPDKFKNRIIFPIADIMGNVVGFSARALDKGQEPKYINTPETPIFYKSRLLYGLDKAKSEIKKQQKSLIVEGQMDVVMSHQAGVKIAVASSGTALTQNHLETLGRYSENVIFAFDQDTAGYDAAKKSIDLAITREMNVKMVVLPVQFKDAGEAIAKDEKIWQEAVKIALPAIDWYFGLAFANTGSATNKDTNDHELSIDEKKKIAKELLPVIKKIPNEIEKSHYIQLLAKELKVPEKSIQTALAKTKLKTEKIGVPGENIADRKKNLATEDFLVALLIKFPEHIEKTVSILDYQDFPPESKSQKIYKFMQSCYTKSSCKEGSKSCDFKINFQKCLAKNIDIEARNELQANLFSIDQLYADHPSDTITSEIKNCLELIKSRKKEKIKVDFAQLIKEAEEKGDRAEVKRLIDKLQSAMI